MHQKQVKDLPYGYDRTLGEKPGGKEKSFQGIEEKCCACDQVATRWIFPEIRTLFLTRVMLTIGTQNDHHYFCVDTMVSVDAQSTQDNTSFFELPSPNILLQPIWSLLPGWFYNQHLDVVNSPVPTPWVVL